MSEEYGESLQIHLSPRELEDIDGWRKELSIDSREEAVRRLIKLGLKASHEGGDEQHSIVL
ncbi:MAG: hypothetical protein ACE5Q3_05345 [Alphaproteobacteria bacterium]